MKKARKQRIFVVDTNWYLWRAFYTLRTNRPVEEALPHHLLSMVCKDAQHVRADYVLCGFDGPKVFRYEIFPGYKGERAEKKKSGHLSDEQQTGVQGSAYDYLPNIYQFFSEARIAYFQPRKREADDVCKSIALAYCADYDIVCGAQDKDHYQYLKEGIRLFDSSHKNKAGERDPIYITHEDVPKLFGVRADQMIQYQVLHGDKADSIPRIGGLEPLQIKKGLQKYDNMARWYKEDEEIRPIFDANREYIKRNRKLVTLTEDALPPSKPSEWRPPKAKSDIHSSLPKAFHGWYDMLYPKSKGLFG